MAWSDPLRKPLPLILIRGFGGIGVEDEKRIAYQGFNDGTVYPGKRGENYIYEGMILRFLKSSWQYQDATNVVGYYGVPVADTPELPDEIKALNLDPTYFAAPPVTGQDKIDPQYKVVIDPGMARALIRSMQGKDICRTVWVYRYYDLDDRNFVTYGKALVRLIAFIRALSRQQDGTEPKVNIIAHSMGGLLVREAIQCTYPMGEADKHINKVVTLGTPHRGIAFQLLKEWIGIEAGDELNHFSPDFQKDPTKQAAFVNLDKYFPPERFLTVVGTNYRSYGVTVASWANRLASITGEFGMNYNRSDGLVKQISAQLPGAPRTFIHKCHGGPDSLVTARESFEIATRFFFGNVRARLRLHQAKILRGQDFFGKSEFYFGVSIKPRKVDFELFHQSAEAENCYGPFRQEDLGDAEVAFSWAGPRKLIWEGYLDTRSIMDDPSVTPKDLVLRLEVYVSERDVFGIGFSDNIIFHKQYYVRALWADNLQGGFQLYLHTGEEFAGKGYQVGQLPPMQKHSQGGWEFGVSGTGFQGTFVIEIDQVPEHGVPVPYEAKDPPNTTTV
jgi:PGAP1-like protein